MSDHQTCELISIYKHKFYGMLHTCKLKGAFRESRRCDKETLCRARPRQSAHKCLQVGPSDTRIQIPSLCLNVDVFKDELVLADNAIDAP